MIDYGYIAGCRPAAKRGPKIHVIVGGKPLCGAFRRYNRGAGMQRVLLGKQFLNCRRCIKMREGR